MVRKGTKLTDEHKRKIGEGVHRQSTYQREHALTPPKWIAAQRNMELEDRLGHFIDWLEGKDVRLCHLPDMSQYTLDTPEIASLIEEYVNT